MKHTTLLVMAALGGTGCMTVTSKVPGVLDLRSDGADAPVRNEPLPANATRAGFDGFAFGEGVKGGADVLIEDRSHFAINLITIANESSSEEWKAALDGQAMRNVAVTEQMSPMGVVVSILKGCIPAVGGLIEGTWDFRARGTRISAVPSVREESIPPPAADTDTTGAAPGVGF